MCGWAHLRLSAHGSRGGAGVNTGPRDFARVGWFWLNQGNWSGKQLLPSSYFEKYMKPDVPRDLPRTKQNGDDYLGIGSYGGGNDQNFPGQGSRYGRLPGASDIR